MSVKFKWSDLRKTRWHEYATRFLFGGAVTVLAGIIAKQFGPGVGGLFLAFPAIFPASASLMQKHEREKKERAGLDGEKRGRVVVAVDAAGAAIGCVGLAAFAAVTWKVVPHFPSAIVLAAATLAWLAVAVALWKLRKHAERLTAARGTSSEGRILKHEDQ